jgi:hypothetical protein
MGLLGPLLAYKTTRHGGVLTVADRWFASSQIHHGCTQPDGTSCRLTGKHRLDKQLVCPQTGEFVDRDHNAARNLRQLWPSQGHGPIGTQTNPKGWYRPWRRRRNTQRRRSFCKTPPPRRGRKRRGQNPNPARGRRMSVTKTPLLYNRPDTSTYHISPGDLDEGIKALLVFRGEGDVQRQGAGYGRVKAFREGVINGAQSCTNYQDK